MIGVATVKEERGEATFGAVFADGDSRRVDEDIGQRDGLALVDFLFGDDRDGRGDVLHRSWFGLRGDDNAGGEARDFQAEVERAELICGEVDVEFARQECGSGEGDGIAAGRKTQRVAAVRAGVS